MSPRSLASGTSLSAELADQSTYLFYVQGEYAGKCDVRFSEKGDALVFESKTVIDWEDYKLELASRTEVNKKTLQPILFEYEGVKTRDKMSGTIHARGDSIWGVNTLNGAEFPSSARITEPLYFFQNYVSDHQVVIAWAIDRAEDPFIRFITMLPSEFMQTGTIATLDSEIELPTVPQPTVCKKFTVAMKNSSPYYLYYDPKRRAPVYMDFPSVMTEVFLDDAYDDKPPVKYERPKEPE